MSGSWNQCRHEIEYTLFLGGEDPLLLVLSSPHMQNYSIKQKLTNLHIFHRGEWMPMIIKNSSLNFEIKCQSVNLNMCQRIACQTTMFIWKELF